MKHTIAVVDPLGVAGSVATSLAAASDLDVVLCRPSLGQSASGVSEPALSVPGAGGDLVVAPELADVPPSDVVVLAGGTRITDTDARAELSEGLAELISSCDSPVVIVSNDTSNLSGDAMLADSDLAPSRIIGTGTLLDSLRLGRLIADELCVTSAQVQALAVGAPGPQAIPLVRLATVSGVPISYFLNRERVDAVAERFRAGDDVVDYEVASDRQGVAVERIVSAVGRGRRVVAPIAVHLDGQYGIDGQFLSVPAVLDTDGVEEIIDLDLSLEELVELHSLGRAAAREVEALAS